MQALIFRSFISLFALCISQTVLYANWSKPITIEGPGFAQSPRVSINKEGKALIAFARSATSADNLQIEAATLINGVASEPHVFPLSNFVNANFPNVSFNKHDKAAIGWVEFDDEGNTQLVASSLVKGIWTLPQVLSSPGAEVIIPASGATYPQFPGVNMDSRGNGIAVWLEEAAGVFSIQASRLKNRKWSQIETIFNTSGSFGLSFPVLAGNSRGDVVIAWFDLTKHVLQAAQYKNGKWMVKTFDESNVLTNIPLLPPPAIAINESGDALIAWVDNNGAADVVRLVAGKWHESKIISDFSRGRVFFLDCAIDAAGQSTVLWNILNVGSGSNIVQASQHVNGYWQNPVILVGATNSPESVNKTYIAMGAKNNAVSIIQQFNAQPLHQLEARVLKNGNWLAPFTIISNPLFEAMQAALAMNSQGKAVVVWASGDSPTQTIQASINNAPFK